MKKDKHLKRLVEQAVLASFKDGKLVSEKVQSFIKSFKALPRSKAIFALTEYSKGIKRELDMQTLVVESTTPLSSDEKRKIITKMEKQFSILNSQYSLNPALLGGLRVKIGDTVYDDSIEARINQLREEIRG